MISSSSRRGLRVLLAVFFGIAAPAAHAQTAIAQRHTIVANPPDAMHLEKAIGNFTSREYPAYYLGTSSGGYIYDTRKQITITVDRDGNHYESARAFTYPGDVYAGIIASVADQTIWYRNPANHNGGDPTRAWTKQVVLNSYCHDLRIADIDGDGKQDVVCSGTNLKGKTVARIGFQDDIDRWQEIDLYENAGDSIAVLKVDGRNGIVGCAGSSLDWYENPAPAKTRDFSAWIVHHIGSCTKGTTVTTLRVRNRELVIQASNEDLWPDGLAYFDAGTHPRGKWREHRIDSTYPYRDVHEIGADVLNGIPFITVAEESQASRACNPKLDHHPLVSGCRVAIFPWNGKGFAAPTVIQTLGTQNQAMYQLHGVEYMLGANHNAYDDFDKPLYLWTFTFQGHQKISHRRKE